MDTASDKPASLPEASPPYGEGDVVLRGGSTVHVRALRPDDEARLAAFFRGLSTHSRSLRFFAAVTDYFLDRAAADFAHGADAGIFSVVASAGADERIVGHALFAATAGDRAEVAFTIADQWHDQGLASLLLGQLAQAASARGVRVFEAIVLPRNSRMLAVFREAGFPVHVQAAPGEIRVEFPTELSSEALEHFERREWVAAVNSVDAFFEPRSVAVIGASRQRGTVGGEVLYNLASYGFHGPLYPVNPNAPSVQNIAAYAGVEEIPGPVDLAVVVVPAALVLEAAAACGRKGVRALVVISAGFAETGPEGLARQDELLRICRMAGMRLMGPNCVGLLNSDPAVRLKATFVPATAPPGRLALMSQSGGLGLAIMEYASGLGLGLSTFASVGNKADLSTNDLIRYWEQDPHTDVILLYLESFGNPRKFARIARRVSRAKPIVAVKSGRSPAGARAAGSHTGALLAASDVTVGALFRQAGVIRTDTLEEMLDVASLLAHQPRPTGRRVAILTNAGGPGILCADACAAEGLEVGPLEEGTRTALRAVLPSAASVGNPVDMLATAGPEQYREAIRILGRDPGVDALVVIFIPPLLGRPEEVALAVAQGAQELKGKKPVLAVFMQSDGAPAELRSGETRIPWYPFPEHAAVALARVAEYGDWLARPDLPPAHFDRLRRDEAVALIAAALGRGAQWLTPEEVGTLLACYGLPVLEQGVATTPEDAAAQATRLGGKVALKGIAQGLVHKTDAGAVRLDLQPEDVLVTARAMEEALRAAGSAPTGFLVQRMAGPGREMIVGVVHDRQFGPVVACGAGGVLVELVKDVSVRLTPLSARDADEMVRELKTYPLLTGYRGAEPSDVPALVEMILRVSVMVEDLLQIAELDLNPVVVRTHGAEIVDARIRVAPSTPPLPLGALPSARIVPPSAPRINPS